ncbi:MAG TPA: type II toxin-antitoxin system RelE/ParE family toxin [Gammaproteobacteria bacterium]|nr:type II toxin-antitoxin system RelE/ParE family toxin [Gammaproteobacteria bacterium]
MADYQINIEKTAAKSLQKIPKSDQAKIINAIQPLAHNPRPSGCKKLVGRDGWRIRIGNYRVIYEINDGQLRILIIEIGHRKEIYR